MLKSLDTPKWNPEKCCIANGVSQGCLDLCRKDKDYSDYGNYDDTRFPADTSCEKHKLTINKCWKKEGIRYSIFTLEYNINNIMMGDY